MQARITSVTIQGHTSIRDAQVQIRPLNVLVGANGAGKSNFVRALELLASIIEGGCSCMPDSAEDRQRCCTSREVIG